MLEEGAFDVAKEALGLSDGAGCEGGLLLGSWKDFIETN